MLQRNRGLPNQLLEETLSSWTKRIELHIFTIEPSMKIAKFVTLFFIFFVALRHANPTGILFYQGIVLGILITVAQLSLILRQAQESKHLHFKDGAITFLLIYAFIITIPTHADRSFSLKMLQRVAEAPSGLTRGEIREFYTADFVGRGGLDQRLIEQQTTGTMLEQNGRFTITSAGRAVTDVARFTCRMFVCQNGL